MPRGWDEPGDVLPASRRLGATGCTRDRRPHHARGGQESLGLLEVLRSTAARWASLESETVVAGVLPTPAEPAAADQEAAASPAPPPPYGHPAAECRVGRGLHE